MTTDRGAIPWRWTTCVATALCQRTSKVGPTFMSASNQRSAPATVRSLYLGWEREERRFRSLIHAQKTYSCSKYMKTSQHCPSWVVSTCNQFMIGCRALKLRRWTKLFLATWLVVVQASSIFPLVPFPAISGLHVCINQSENCCILCRADERKENIFTAMHKIWGLYCLHCNPARRVLACSASGD